MSNDPKTMELHFPHASRSSHLPIILPSVAAASFWLVSALKTSTGGHLRPWCILYLFLFSCSIRCPKRWDGIPPRAPCPARLRSNTPPTASADYQVDCCLKSLNGSHLRPEPGASLYFLCDLFRRSNRRSWQRRERTERPAPASDP
jgi:hypothetical protein